MVQMQLVFCASVFLAATEASAASAASQFAALLSSPSVIHEQQHIDTAVQRLAIRTIDGIKIDMHAEESAAGIRFVPTCAE